MKKRIIQNVALIGYGYWGKILKQYIEKKWNLKCICAVNYQDSCSFESILLDSSIDTVFVCTPANTHYPIVKKLLQNRKNVFCEKPLSLSSKESTELINISHKEQVALFVDYIYCYSNSLLYLLNSYQSSFESLKGCHFKMFQMGKFYDDADCFQSLGVHFLALLGYLNAKYRFFDKEKCNIAKTATSCYGADLPASGSITIRDCAGFVATIDISQVSIDKYRELFFSFGDLKVLLTPTKEITFSSFRIEKNEVVYEKQESFDESNNIINVLNEFEAIVESGNNYENEQATYFANSVLDLVSTKD